MGYSKTYCSFTHSLYEKLSNIQYLTQGQCERLLRLSITKIIRNLVVIENHRFKSWTDENDKDIG